MTRITILFATILTVLSGVSVADAQSFDPPGALVAGSGRGVTDGTVWAPTMRFPMEYGPAYANSQVYAPGGSMPGGRSGGQCSDYNYGYPWRDNFCETRGWSVPLCPSGRGHQGQDIRPGVCTRSVVPGVAAARGRIADIGSYSVDLVADDGTRYEYLHMDRIAVREGQRVECGDRLGYISNAFGGTPTTIHLHFNIRMAVRGVGSAFVPPYTSLRESYGRLGSGDACAPPMDAGVRDAGARPDAGRTDAGRSDAGRRDAGTGPGSRMCRSTTLGRNVADGECVQVGAAVASCGTGCGWARCDAGAWTCISDLGMCGGTTHPNAECSPEGGSCRSDTLGRNVDHGTCVQVTRGACGESSCAWYRCVDGNWACTELTSCTGERAANASCDEVCNPVRAVCADRLECCGGRTNSNIECYEGYCEDTSVCLSNGDTGCGTTVPDGTGLPHCCGPMVCGLDTTGTPECCAVPGQPCEDSFDCCGFELCSEGICQPQETGERCMNTQECVGADYCTDEGVCGTD